MSEPTAIPPVRSFSAARTGAVLAMLNDVGVTSVIGEIRVTYGIKSVPPAETNPVIEINSPTKNLLTAV